MNTTYDGGGDTVDTMGGARVQGYITGAQEEIGDYQHVNIRQSEQKLLFFELLGSERERRGNGSAGKLYFCNCEKTNDLQYMLARSFITPKHYYSTQAVIRNELCV